MLTSFQLRVSRSVLGIGVREIGNLLNISRTTVSIWENQNNLDYINENHQYSEILTRFFRQNNIHFPDHRTIELFSNRNSNNDQKKLTRFQLKAARITIKISQLELANSVGALQQVIARAEMLRNEEFIRIKNKDVITKLLKIFQSNNIYFPDNLSIQICTSPTSDTKR